MAGYVEAIGLFERADPKSCPMVVLGEEHLRRVLNSYARYYNEMRTYRSLNKQGRCEECALMQMSVGEAQKIVAETGRRYFDSRRSRVNGFIDSHFSLSGSLASTSRTPRPAFWSRTISASTARLHSTKSFRPSKPGAWSSASNGTTLQNTAAGSIWPSLNSAS